MWRRGRIGWARGRRFGLAAGRESQIKNRSVPFSACSDMFAFWIRENRKRVIAACVGLLLVGCSFLLVEARKMECRASNSDVYLPAVNRGPLAPSRDAPSSWLYLGKDNLVVSNPYHVIGLTGARPQWCLPIRPKWPIEWSLMTAMALGIKGTLFVVQGIESTEHDDYWEGRINVYAIDPARGEMLARQERRLAVDGVAVLAAIRWEEGILIVCGHPGHSKPEIEEVVAYGFGSGALAEVEAPALKGMLLFGRAGLVSGGALLVYSRKTNRLQVIDSEHRDAAPSINVNPGDLAKIGPGVGYVPSHNVLLTDYSLANGDRGLIAYDLREGGVRWHVKSPCAFTEWDGIAYHDGKILATGLRDSRGVVCSIDLSAGDIRVINQGRGEDFSPDLPSGGISAFRGGEILFVANNEDRSHRICRHVIYRYCNDGELERWREVSIQGDDGEGLLGSAVFLIAGNSGCWAGFSSGVVAFRDFSAGGPPVVFRP